MVRGKSVHFHILGNVPFLIQMLNSFVANWRISWTSCCLQHAGWNVIWSTSL